MNYGELVDKNWKDNDFYNIINDYFNSPIMLKDKDTENYSIYICKLHSLLSVEKRYIIVITLKDDNKIGDNIPLKNIKWVSFQSRTMTNRNKLQSHKYSVKRTDRYNIPIYETSKDKKAVYYRCEGYNDIVITILYTENTKHYQSKGTLVNALETFNTIISFNN